MLYRTPVEVIAAASPALLARGCVNVLSLEGIRSEAGERWPRIRDGVYGRMETLLRQKLGPTDFFTRIDDESYLVTMPAAEPEDVNVVCLRVAYDLYTSFIGQCDLGNIHVSTAIGADEEGLTLKRLSRDQIISLAEKAGVADLIPPNLPRNGVSPLLSVLADRAINSVSPLQRREQHTSLNITHEFVPAWVAPNCAITTYICEPKSIMVAETGMHITLAQLSPKERVQAELSCLHAGIAQLARSAQKGNRFLLGVNISFEVLGSPNGRMEFLSALHNLSYEYRPYLDYTINEVPPGVAQTRLNNMVNMLRPFGRSVSATVAPASRVYTAYQGIGLRSMGLDLREYASALTFDDDLRNLLHMAKVMKLATFLCNVRKLETLQSPHASSVQILSGPAVALPCEEPRGMWRLSWDDIVGGSVVAL